MAEPSERWERSQRAPFKSYGTIFDQETRQAVAELQRPGHGLIISGILAGFGIGLSVLVIAVLLTHINGTLHPVVTAILIANAYTIGFIVVIMGRTDLFTEYTTIAIFPVLVGEAPVRSLVRLWGFVYVANFVGASAFAGLLAVLGPELGVIEREVFGEIAHELIRHSGWVILLSAFLAGWLMGLLSWLVTAGRESISQTVFIWLITGSIGFGQLHHVVTGTVEVLAAFFTRQGVTAADVGHFLLWTTVGNAVGGVLFALLVRYSVLLSSKDGGSRGAA